MSLKRAVFFSGVLGLVVCGLAFAQANPPRKPDFDTESFQRRHPLEQIYYKKEIEQEYREALERDKRMREMEAWDTQRKLVKRELLDVHCVWKRPDGREIKKVFEKRIAANCDAAIADLSRDLGKPLSADCSCTHTSPVAENP